MNHEILKKSKMLFLYFIKIGCFTFGGGWSILAQIEQEFVDKKKLITKNELVELAAVGRSVPGIMITNISMLLGYQIAGWFGGLCAVVGIALPAVVILSLVTLFYDILKGNYWFESAMQGVTCAVVPIIAGAAISLGKEVFRQREGIVICAITFVLSVFTGLSNIAIILLGVLVALIWMGVEKHASV